MGRVETIYRRTLADIRNIVQDYETDDQFRMSDFSIEPGDAVSKREMTMIQNMLNKDYEKLQWNHKRGFVTDEQYMFQSKIYDAMQRTIDKARYYHLGEAYTNASLMNVRNQLMNKLGAEFDVMGGSTTPKIIITPDKYKNIQFEIQANGQGVEVMPIINSIPDYLHKRKGIAFMQAANVLYDFIMNILKTAKNETISRCTKLMIREDDVFEKTYVPYEMKRFSESINESYSSSVFTPRALKTLKVTGFEKENVDGTDVYWVKKYVDCTIQITPPQGYVTVYDENDNVIYCPIKYVQSVEEIEELDNWGEFGGD